LVPERRQEKTTEAGLDVLREKKSLQEATEKLKAKNITVSYFVDPVLEHIDTAKDCGADAVEIHTGAYANATAKGEIEKRLNEIEAAVSHALSKDLIAHVGHGLDYQNVVPLANMGGITEFNIGFSIIGRSIFVGLEEAVKEMRLKIRSGA